MTTTDSEGVTVKRGDAASPEVFTAIGEVTGVPTVNPSRSMRDVTNLTHTGHRFKPGLVNGGTMAIPMNFDKADTGQTGLRTDFDGKTERNFQIVLNDTSPFTTVSFAAFVEELEALGAAVDEVIPFAVTLRVNSTPVWA